jgi:hypothetical protein
VISWGGGDKGGLGGGICPPPACMLKKALHYREGAYIQPDTCQIMPIYINLQFSHSISQY